MHRAESRAADEHGPGQHGFDQRGSGAPERGAGARRAATAVRTGPAPRVPHPSGPIEGLSPVDERTGPSGPAFEAVSYTHLTLPTKA